MPALITRQINSSLAKRKTRKGRLTCYGAAMVGDTPTKGLQSKENNRRKIEQLRRMVNPLRSRNDGIKIE